MPEGWKGIPGTSPDLAQELCPRTIAKLKEIFSAEGKKKKAVGTLQFSGSS